MAIAVISSPYAYEVSNGISFESFIGANFIDHDDRSALTSGIRISYLEHDERDRLITAEAQFISQTVFTGEQYDTPLQKWGMDANLAFYEFYHPFCFRLLGGPSIERRLSKYNFGANYRMGLGYYYSSHLGFMTDIGGRALSRSSGTTTPYDFTFSVQIVF